MTTRWILDFSTGNEPHGSVRYKSGEKINVLILGKLFFCQNMNGISEIWLRFESKSEHLKWFKDEVPDGS